MDESVLRAMVRWPDVPAVFGWLSLDRRGRWLIRGETIGHRAALAFISRNYAGDERGRWYFQNGPQRVYVNLEYTPWVLRLDAGAPHTHTGLAVREPRRVLVDERGAVLVDTEHGVGLVDDRDLAQLPELLCDASGAALDEDEAAARIDLLAAGRPAALCLALCGRRIVLESVASGDVAARFGFDPDPRADATTDQNA